MTDEDDPPKTVLDWRLPASIARPSGPRTWSLPAEPGPEVKALRDEDGTIWRPVLDAFSGSIMWSMQGVVLWSFLDLLVEHGPLTDATGKAPE